MKRNRKIRILVLIGCIIGALLIRVLLLSWSLQYPRSGDFIRYEDWARIAHVYSLSDTYQKTHLSFSKNFPNNQPPGSLYIISGAYELYIFIGKVISHATHTHAGSILWVNTALQQILIKIPSILADLLMGFCIYLLVRKESGEKRALFAGSLIWFNPIIIYNSTIWGQTDSLNNFFFILSLLFAFRRQYMLSILSYAISLYIKFSLLPLLPFYLLFIFILKKREHGKIFVFLGMSILLLSFITLPIYSNPFLWFVKEAPIIVKGEAQYISSNAFNFWWFASCLPQMCSNIPSMLEKIFGISFAFWGYFIFTLFSLPLLFLQVKKSIVSKKNIHLLLALVALSVFLFLPAMHDRYLYPFFPLFAIFVGLTKKNLFPFLLFALLSLLHLVNLVYSWYPSHFPFSIFYIVIYNKFFTWCISGLTVVLFLWLYVISLRYLLRQRVKS